MSLTPLQQWHLTCASYRRLITDALNAQDKETAEFYQRILREKEMNRPDAAPRRPG